MFGFGAFGYKTYGLVIIDYGLFSHGMIWLGGKLDFGYLVFGILDFRCRTIWVLGHLYNLLFAVKIFLFWGNEVDKQFKGKQELNLPVLHTFFLKTHQ